MKFNTKRKATTFLTFAALALGLLAFMALLSAPAGAQGGSTPQPTVSDDQVNVVARKLFCPVCENIPLDTCGTAACAQWRDEIRIQLQSGKSDQQVIDDFVKRYGDRVVGTPQDPTLRGLALIMPWATSLAALGVAVFIFIRWRVELVALSRKAAGRAASENTTAGSVASEDEYRARLERDVAQRR